MADETPIWRQVGAWQGGTVAALAISPHFLQDGIVLAATGAGLFRSTDGGQQWVCQQEGLSDPRVTTVTFAPATPVAFSATADGRLFQSPDRGASWQEVTSWAGLGWINAIAPSPHFATDQTLFVATNEGVFRSQDGGQSWESSTFGLLDLEILCLACAPNFAESQLLWAGSALGGLYRSRNGARSWRDAGQGLPDMAMQCIAVSPNFVVDQTLYVGTESDGLYRSTDGGASWQAVTPVLAGQSVNVLALGTDGQTLFVGTSDGVYCSSNGGEQWTQTQGSDFIALALAIASDGTALAGAYQTGVLRWSASDNQWQTAVIGLAAHAPPTVLFAKDQPLYLLDIEGALVAYQAEGKNWRALQHDLAEEPVIAAAIATDAQGDILYAVTQTTLYYTQLTPAAPEIDHWQRMPLPEASVAPQLLVAARTFAQAPVLLLADGAGALFSASAGGAQWLALTVPWSTSQLLQLAFASDDSGRTIYALTVQPHAEHNYLLQLWQTGTADGEWLALADFYAEVPVAVLTVPHDPVEESILVGVRNRLIKLYHPSAGQGWAVSQHFLPDTLRITSIVTTGGDKGGARLYVTTNDGVCQSDDGGATWTPVGEGLAGRTIVAFQPAMNDQPAYAVALGGTIWQG